MQKFKKKGSETLEAIQFDPHGKWPECITAWTDYVPRDMSWGYIEIMGGKKHIRAGDWIFKDEMGDWNALPDNIFQQIYEPAGQ